MLARETERQSARIGNAEIRAVIDDLEAWLADKSYDVRAIGASIKGGLTAAQLGYVPHPVIRAKLAEDVAKLAAIRASR